MAEAAFKIWRGDASGGAYQDFRVEVTMAG